MIQIVVAVALWGVAVFLYGIPFILAAIAATMIYRRWKTHKRL
jgi:hypothetical protein